MTSTTQAPKTLSPFSSGWFILLLLVVVLLWIIDWQQSLYFPLYQNLQPLLQLEQIDKLDVYEVLLFPSILLACVLYYCAFVMRASNSALLLLLTLVLAAAATWWQAKSHAQWLPVIEFAFSALSGWWFGLCERLHQKPLKRLIDEHQQWGLETVRQLQEGQRLNRAWQRLQLLNFDRDVLQQGYELAEACERKRDYALAKTIYQRLSQGRGYGDSKQKLQKLDSVVSKTPSLAGTVAMDQTLLMPADGLQPPTLGRYRVENILGKGAMGVVYRGIDPAINREVAIKTLSLSAEFEDDEQQMARERFFREAETAGKLNHPNIVTIYDVGEEQDLAFIAMDLLTGVPLDQHIKKDTLLPPPLVYQLMVQVASGLSYAHQKGVVHRDIKPGNLIYDDEKQAVIITDFGIAHLTDHSKTRTGAILGSPFYMSPEQVQGKKVDGRSDIFSLGITFYQMLTGTLPFKGDSLATVALNITTKKHEPVRKIRADLPASASRIINKALQKEADKRYQSIEEFKDALINALKRDFRANPFN